MSKKSFVVRQEKKGDHGDSDLSDAIVAQVKMLAMEVKQLSSVRQITVLNGNSRGNATALIVPAAVLGTVGYGYMRWKGLSFSDLMYVTKKSMSVSSLTKHLEHVSDALAIERGVCWPINCRDLRCQGSLVPDSGTVMAKADCLLVIQAI